MCVGGGGCPNALSPVWFRAWPNNDQPDTKDTFDSMPDLPFFGCLYNDLSEESNIVTRKLHFDILTVCQIDHSLVIFFTTLLAKNQTSVTRKLHYDIRGIIIEK